MSEFLFEDLPASLELAAREAVAALAARRNILLLCDGPNLGPAILARRLVSALPEPSPTERAQAFRNFACAGLISEVLTRENPDNGLSQWVAHGPGGRPFRAPHYTISAAALRGQCDERYARPGEVALAHGGILYLEELDQYSIQALEAVCKPARAFPARPRAIVAATTLDADHRAKQRSETWGRCVAAVLGADHAIVRVPMSIMTQGRGCRFTTEEARAVVGAADEKMREED